MTTYTDRAPLPAWLWLLPLLAFAAGALLAVIATPNGRVMTSAHAVERHGSDADAIRCQLQKNGALETWQTDNDPCVQVWLTQLKCGRFGIMIAQLWPSLADACDWRERSSFVPRDGSYQRVVDYLNRFASQLK